MSIAADPRLSQIQTQWSLVFDAHRACDQTTRAQHELLLRYSGAALRYLRAATGTLEAAEELCQEFALKVVRGAFRNAAPEKGRFRHFLKAALANLVADHYRQRNKLGSAKSLDSAPDSIGPPTDEDLDREFIEQFRLETLDNAWRRLAAEEAAQARPWYTVLRFRAEHPELSSSDLALALRAKRGLAISAENVRQILHRARMRFARLLVDEVADALGTRAKEELREELETLGVLTYCRAALEEFS